VLILSCFPLLPLEHEAPVKHFVTLQFLNLIGSREGSACRKDLYLHRTTQTQTQISLPRVGFELTSPVSTWVKTVHSLDRAATCEIG
jgi:hypothetical protein